MVRNLPKEKNSRTEIPSQKCLQALEASRKEYAEEMERRVVDALRGLRESGQSVSFYKVAEWSGVSRSSLYRRPNLRRLVEQARFKGNAKSVEEL